MSNNKWVKFDLHHHTGEDYQRKEEDFDYEEILDFFNKNEIKLISITNHNTVSKKSFETYSKIIDEKNYDIKMLPGIEVQFKMKGTSKLGHINIIFSDEYSLSKLELFFNDKNNYDKDSNEYFNEYFPKLMIKLQENHIIDFIIMPDFDKSNRVDFETIKDLNLSPWLQSFDILEGKGINQKSLKRIEVSIEKSDYDQKKAIYAGTDGHNTKSCIESVSKIPFVWTEYSYEGLRNMVIFSSTRIFLEEGNPYLLDEYISSIEINGEEINFSPGLNTIIGRRGSGKSFLVNSIIKKTKPNFDFSKDTEFDKDIVINGHFSEDNILFFKQSQLAETLSEFIHGIAAEKIESFDLIKHIFGEEKDRINFSSPVVDFISSQQNMKITLKKLLNLNLEKEKDSSKSTIENYQSELYDKFLLILNQDRKQISIINDDIDILDKILELKKMSKWLKNNFLNIKNKLTLIKSTFVHPKQEEITKLILLIQELQTSIIFSTKDGDLIEKIKNQFDELKLVKIEEKYNDLKSFINDLRKFVVSVNNNENFIHKNIGIETNRRELTPLTFDNQIISVCEGDDFPGIISKFLSINLKEDLSAKKAFKSSDAINKDFIEIKIIPKINDEDISRDSVGTKHQKFMNMILDIDNASIIILDQPDDDLDAKTIQETLLRRFQDNFFNKQWIVITHDPKIVVNSDSRNVVLSNYLSSSIEDEKRSYFNIEKKELKENAYEILDAKKEYPKIRGKIYE